MFLGRTVRFAASLPFVLLAVSLFAGGCASQRVEEGYVNVIGGRIWYRMVGDGPGTPLIVVHGGPAVPSQYLKSLERLANDRPVIFYDQLGCGKSDRPYEQENDELWIPRRFGREIEALREHLNLRDCFIYADSWGAIVGTEYLLSQPTPKGVRGLVLTSPILSVPRSVADAQRLVDKLDAKHRDAIRRHEAEGTTGSKEYKQAYGEFFERHVYRRWFKPDEMNAALANVGWVPYLVMHGTNHVDVNGTLKEYDRTGDLFMITAPTLITVGQHDEVSPETAAFYQSRLHNAHLVVFRRSSHSSIFEEQDAHLRIVRDFLRDRDGH